MPNDFKQYIKDNLGMNIRYMVILPNYICYRQIKRIGLCYLRYITFEFKIHTLFMISISAKHYAKNIFRNELHNKIMNKNGKKTNFLNLLMS